MTYTLVMICKIVPDDKTVPSKPTAPVVANGHSLLEAAGPDERGR